MRTVEILLVEDNAGDAVLIRQILADCSVPINLHIARDGEQALIMLGGRDFKPDLIILDLNIPRISGAALLERWQRLEREPQKDIPVVVFSSSLNEAEQQHALSMGAREFISKPTDLQEFVDAIYAIVQKWVLPKVNGTVGGA